MVLITVIVRSKTTIYLQDDHKVYLPDQMSVAQPVDHLWLNCAYVIHKNEPVLNKWLIVV
jgi:hypothetical protein